MYSSAEELLELYRKREVSPVEVVKAYLHRIDLLNPKLNAYITVDHERALDTARKAEKTLASRNAQLPALHGIPLAVKDTEFTKGLRTTSGSQAFYDFVPTEDSILVARLRQAGAILLGKTNTPELGMGAETESVVGGYCVNPWNPARTSGGSSGGSAAAVAAGLTCLASGSDGAGSITTPSAFCGVFGVKPTHGRVPYWPMPNPWPTFHDVGPIARCVGDAAVMLCTASGHDPRDSLSLKEGIPDLQSALQRQLTGLRVGWSSNLGYAVVEPEVESAAQSAARLLESIGIAVEEACPKLPYPFDIWPTIARAEEYVAFGHLLKEAPDQLTPDVRSRLEIGRAITHAEYTQYLQEMVRFRRAIEEFFLSYDVLMTPMNAVPAFEIRTPPSEIAGKSVSPEWESFTPFALCANLSELPAATVPCGLSFDGLPMGLMVMTRFGADALLLSVCATLERELRRVGGIPDLRSN